MADYLLTFLRHGQSTGNKKNYFQGQSDTELTDVGRDQIKRLIECWQAENKHFDGIVSSPLSRARTTAELISKHQGVEVEIDPLWIERDTGRLTEVDREEAKRLPFFNDYYTPFSTMGETGEGDWQLFMRASKALHCLLIRPPGAYLIVSHGGLLNQVLRVIVGVVPQPMSMGANFYLDNTGYATVAIDLAEYRWRILSVNDTHHMK